MPRFKPIKQSRVSEEVAEQLNNLYYQVISKLEINYRQSEIWLRNFKSAA